MDSVEQKLKKAIQLLNESELSNYKIWQGTKISQTSIARYRNGNMPTPANAEILIRFLEGYQNNDAYLITSSGVKYYELPNGKYRMRVPLIPIEAYAKYIDEYRDAEFIDNLEETEFIVDKIGHGRYFAFEIKGDSMDDGSIKSIPHGSTVLARELKREHWIDGNGLKTKDYPYWIIVLDNTILCKQIIKQDKIQGKYICHSLNPSKEYNSDFDVNIDDIKQLLNIIQKTLPAF